MRLIGAAIGGFGLAVAFGAVAGPAAADCASVLRFEKNAAIRIDDLARVGTNEFKDVDGNYLVQAQAFRTAERPRKDGWHALAIVLAGEIGISHQELGGILWTTRPEQFGDRPLRLEKNREGSAGRGGAPQSA